MAASEENHESSTPRVQTGDGHPPLQVSKPETVLITGVSGGQGRLLTQRLSETHRVVGVDRLPWEGHPSKVKIYQLDMRKRAFEDVFRKERPTTVVHLAFIRHFKVDPEVRHEVNVLGTKRVMEFCHKHGVRQFVLLSSHYVYGALPENPYFLDEDAPLNASRTYPEIRDLVETDSIATTFLWKYPKIHSMVLRPVNILGYYVHSAVSRYLKLRRIPIMWGFDPMMQFIHEEDVAEAIALAIEKEIRGVFNVVGPGAVPLSVAIRETGGKSLSMPEPVARMLIDRLFKLGLY
ncbi:MAG: NAD-dependent epimerase/dehydratase family protein, partial [Myxococcota bacterium]